MSDSLWILKAGASIDDLLDKLEAAERERDEAVSALAEARKALQDIADGGIWDSHQYARAALAARPGEQE